ncbi:MAG: hypothetical protein IKY45_04015 [Clostridia bacterium]|nr:hypothetical protein [Clostridia bacterium]
MKKIIAVLLVLAMVFCLVGCSEAERVSHNLSKQADNFNIVRQLTVINCIEGDCSYLMLDIKTIKAEAYKEFAERLKQVFWSKAECDFLIRGIVDNLFNELVGDEDGKS